MLSGVIINNSPNCPVASHRGSCRARPGPVLNPGARKEGHPPISQLSWDTHSSPVPSAELSSASPPRPWGTSFLARMGPIPSLVGDEGPEGPGAQLWPLTQASEGGHSPCHQE